jgi:peptidoglycan glycosyltransferase
VGVKSLQKNIRILGAFFIFLAVALLLNLTYIQVFGQQSLEDNPANTRRLIKEYSIARGNIITSDGTIVAQSRQTNGTYEYVRSYPQGDILSHLIGYDSPQFGRSGLELEYNGSLLGREPSHGWVDQMTKNITKGYDLRITIDSRVQEAAARALGARKGAVVAIDPRDGSLLACYSWPTFNPNLLVSQEVDAQGSLKADAQMRAYSQDATSPLLNRATMGLFTPGSSFKILTASAGIESGFAPDTTYDCPGVWPVGGSRVVNYGSPPRDFGSIDMDTALTYSVNTYFAQLAYNIGSRRLVDCAQAFGMNAPIPLDYPGVAASTIPSPDRMDSIELAWTGAGQGELLLTPLQLALFACAIADGGVIMLPHLMKDIRNGDEILERFENRQWKTPIASSTASEVLSMMVDVVKNGTGSAAAIDGVTVAGKTGTAEVQGKANHAWFVGIAPAESPQVVVAVIVENGGGGGSVAAPIAKQVIQSIIK